MKTMVNRLGPARAPDFFCIGAEKCGTTWLWEMFKDHPEIGVTMPKELRYFAREYLNTGLSNFTAVRRLMTDHNQVPTSRKFLEKLATELRVIYGDDQAYLRIFGAMTEKSVGDVSPQYCLLPEEAIARMHRLAPKAKIIFMMRDPVERAVSAGKMKAGEDDANLSNEAVEAKALIPFQLRMSRFSNILERYEKFFEGQIFVGCLDDLIKDPLHLLKEICAFLEVSYDPSYFLNLEQVANEGASFKVHPDIKAKLFRNLAGEYDRLSARYPERVTRWRALHEA